MFIDVSHTLHGKVIIGRNPIEANANTVAIQHDAVGGVLDSSNSS